MSLDLPSQSVRRERLVATCRVVLALVSLLALWLDPTEPARLASFAYALVAAYAAYALVLAAWVWRAQAMRHWLPFAFHGIDLALFAAIVLVTAVGSSPFFVTFVFAVVAAAVRWRGAGTLWTALAALALFLATIAGAARLFPEAEIELGRVIIRATYLAVIAFMLGYLGAVETRVRARAATLAAWPVGATTDVTALVPELLERAGRALSSPRTVLAWEEREEPWCQVALWSSGETEWWHEPPETALPLAPAALARVPFLASPEASRRGGFRLLTPSGFEHGDEDPVPSWLRDRLGADAVLSVPVVGESGAGRLFALDRQDMTSDELLVGQILARHLALALDQLALFERFHEAGLAEERIHLARDLHDGVIQSLAAAALRLESLRQVLAREPAAAERMIDEIQDLLVGEQRDLREIVATLEPERGMEPRGLPALTERLERLAARVERHWHLEVELDNRLDGAALAPGLGHEIYSIVREALVNASRHGHATRAQVTLCGDAEAVRVTIRDDGCGFPFRGRYDLPTLTASKLGPLSLKARITALGGRLVVESSPSGACVDVHLPRPQEAGRG